MSPVRIAGCVEIRVGDERILCGPSSSGGSVQETGMVDDVHFHLQLITEGFREFIQGGSELCYWICQSCCSQPDGLLGREVQLFQTQ